MRLYPYLSNMRSDIACVWPVWHYHILPRISQNGMFIAKNVTEHKMCAFTFSTTLSTTCLILRRIHRDTVTNVQTSSYKVPDLLVIFDLYLKFFERFSKNTQISNFMKIGPVGAEVFHADGRTDAQDETNSHFLLKFPNAPSPPKKQNH
jgi:hypothetical protein